jgi:hypothetical protein
MLKLDSDCCGGGDDGRGGTRRWNKLTGASCSQQIHDRCYANYRAALNVISMERSVLTQGGLVRFHLGRTATD